MTAPDPQTPKRGAGFRKAVRAAQSARARARRIRGTTYTPKAQRGAAGRGRVGMIRRPAPPPAAPDGGDEA